MNGEGEELQLPNREKTTLLWLSPKVVGFIRYVKIFQHKIDLWFMNSFIYPNCLALYGQITSVVKSALRFDIILFIRSSLILKDNKIQYWAVLHWNKIKYIYIYTLISDVSTNQATVFRSISNVKQKNNLYF